MKLPMEYKGSICELRTSRNEIIAAGTISDISEDYIEIAGRGGPMNRMAYGVDVKINVFNMKMGFRVLAGKVYISTAEFMRVSDIISLLDYERRHFFRVNTNVPAQMALTAPDKNTPEKFHEVRVVNLSLGGAMVVCPVEFEAGAAVTIKFNLGGGSMAIRCNIKRVGETERKTRFYGCQFLNLKNHEADALCAFIFQRQREQIRRKTSE